MSSLQQLVDEHAHAIAAALPLIPTELVQIIANFSFSLVDVALDLQHASLEAERQAIAAKADVEYQSIRKKLELVVNNDLFYKLEVKISNDCEQLVLEQLAADGLHGCRMVELHDYPGTGYKPEDFTVSLYHFTRPNCICKNAVVTTQPSYHERWMDMWKAAHRSAMWSAFQNQIGKRRCNEANVGWIPEEFRDELTQEYVSKGLHISARGRNMSLKCFGTACLCLSNKRRKCD